MKPRNFLIAGIVLLVIIVLNSSLYTVSPWEQVIITEFGRKIGTPISDAGLHVKKPFIQTVNRFERRILEWDSPQSEMPTKDKLFIFVEVFARWKITNPGLYFERLRDERGALSRLDDILGSETRTAIAHNDLIEVIRTTKERTPTTSGEVSEILGQIIHLDPVKIGRPTIEQEILAAAKPKLAAFGVDLCDIRFKRINYNPSVEARIFDRMISERRQIAERFRSEGAGEASRILGTKELEVNSINSEAYKKIQVISGDAEAKATETYAAAYNQSVESAEFYRFIKTLETYKTSLGGDTTVILSTKSPLLQYLQSEKGNPQPPARATP